MKMLAWVLAFWIALWPVIANAEYITVTPNIGGGGGSTPPGGSNTQVQYNNAGAFGGITGATTNGTTLTLVAPVLGTPASATLTNATGLPISTGVSGLGTGIAAALGVNIGSAGAPVLFNGALGTPSSGTLTNATGLPVSSGISGLGTGIATALSINIGIAGAPVLFNGAGGTPSSMVGTNITGTASGLTAGTVTTNANLTGVITSVGNATSIASQTGTGTKFVVDTNPVLVGPTIGIAVGTSLALGGGSIGTDAFEVTGTTTHNGNLSIIGGSLITSGNLSAAAWTTNGIRTRMAAASYTDTTSSGTIANAYTDLFGASTILASSATTYTNYYGAYFVAPVASTNVTMTNKSALGADSISIGGAAQSTFALAVTGTANVSGTITSGGSFVGGSANTIQWTSRGVFTSPAAGSIQNGGSDVDTNASIVAQTTRSQGALAGGTADQAGKNWTFIASPGKGTGAGGSFVFQTTPAGSTGTVVGTPTTVLTMDSTQNASFAGTVSISGVTTFSAGAQAGNTSRWALSNLTASSTVPNLIPNRSDTTTGIGAQASGNISLIAGGTEQIRIAASGVVTFPTITTDATKTDSAVCQDTTTHQLYFGSGAAGICLGTSSARYKQGIKPLTDGLAQIVALNPVTYRYLPGYGTTDKDLYGFTAEDMDKVMPKLVGRDVEGRPNSVDWAGMVPVLVRAVQELKADNDNLRADVRALKTGTR